MSDTPSLTRVCVAGPAGRLGSAIVRAAAITRDIQLVAGLTRPGSGAIGLDLGAFAGVQDLDVPATDDFSKATHNADVLIDVSTAGAAAEHARRLAETGGPPILIGATGFESHHDDMISAAAEKIAIVKARNFSLGVTLLAEFVRMAAEKLGDDWDIEIFEMHHRAKADAPSGTALMLGEAAADGRGVPFEANAIRHREGMTGPRPKGGIGFAVSRGGGVVGDHQVSFAAEAGMISFTHRAHDRAIFARGALAAARWLVGRKPGLYDMRDVLGF